MTTFDLATWATELAANAPELTDEQIALVRDLLPPIQSEPPIHEVQAGRRAA